MNLLGYPSPHVQVAARVVDGAAVIVLADAGEVIVLNSVGTRIWELADGSHTVQQIVDTIAQEYDVSAEQALQETQEFLKQLEEAQALAQVTGAGEGTKRPG